jgi:SHS2 domain-containing protein
MKADPPWRFLDHTADLRMEVRGATVEDLFRNAARGLTSLLAGDTLPVPDREARVDIEGADYEGLLVDWLREILYLHGVEGFIVSVPRVDALSPSALHGRLLGATPSTEQFPGEIEIKAVTHHGLAVTRDENGFSARIVFDV